MWDQADIDVGIVAFGCHRDADQKFALVNDNFLVSEQNPSSPCGGMFINNAPDGNIRKSLSIVHDKVDPRVTEIVTGVYLNDPTGAARFRDIPGAYFDLMDGTWQHEYFTPADYNRDYQAMFMASLHRTEHLWGINLSGLNYRIEPDQVRVLDAYIPHLEYYYKR